MKFTVVWFALAAAFQGGAPAVEPGFTSLFNGTDLSGWKVSGAPESFTVRDGAIIASGPASHLYYDGSFKNHTFRNFELKIDVMSRAGSNGGVYVLTEFEEIGGSERASGRFPSKGFEVQVYNADGGPRTGSLYHVVDILDQSPAKDDEWFKINIKVEGKRIITKVNDKVISDYTEEESPKREGQFKGRLISSGTFALQGHDPGSEVHFKNIRVKPLP